MRRLAKTFRKDDYSSYRDYQKITTDSVIEYTFTKRSPNYLNYIIDTEYKADDMLSFGGYLYPIESTKANIVLFEGSKRLYEYSQQLNKLWNRIGFCIPINSDSANLSVSIEFECKELKTWGINRGVVDLEHYEVLDGLATNEICDALNLPHLMPEALYLDHQNSELHPNRATSSAYSESIVEDGIELKKCCYCQRYLPIGETIVSSAFHRHKAKVTGYQNECRSCKKWRINDYFNPDRSSDKLNESSIITRERKILLREPEQIIELKNRETGEGLKSQVWKRFQKKCFNCENPLLLKDVQLDHTRPLAYLWPIDQYATCLCSTCNNNKHDSFPVDYYHSEKKLRELSEITGLKYEELIKKDVCEEQLQRVINNIVYFADNLDARTFRSIANKVKEVRPKVDLYDILKKTDEKSYKNLQKRLKERKE